ncbi:MAG TPA: Rad52/Rad22 family DNA repair protein, partial [Trueperaceae bacterium]|nr:Rad52/Rad22 family DNA repair protein [Trueperaceae bacterium]
MQGAEWARLSHPFTPEAIGWYVVEFSEDRAHGRLAPYLKSAAVISRLDEVCGRSNWSFQLAPLGAHALVCNLTVAGVG